MSDLKELERQKQECLEAIKTKEEVDILKANPLFIKYIGEGYCYSECVRATHLSVDLNMPKEVREDALRLAQATGYLELYFSRLDARGHSAAAKIPHIEQEIEAIRMEMATDSNTVDMEY